MLPWVGKTNAHLDHYFIWIISCYLSVPQTTFEAGNRQNGSSRYSQILSLSLTPNKLGDTAATSQYIEPEQATIPSPSAQSCQVDWEPEWVFIPPPTQRRKYQLIFFFETSSSELPLILFESETLFAVAKVSIRSQHHWGSHLMRLWTRSLRPIYKL